MNARNSTLRAAPVAASPSNEVAIPKAAAQKAAAEKPVAVKPAAQKPPALEPTIDTAKRRQILDGARQVFLAHGFEGASMNEVARVAGVSKGTLYVYFDNKERLFAAMVAEERYAHVTQIFDLDPEDPDVEGVLTRVASDLTHFLLQPRIMSAMRVMMGISERMPELAQDFYHEGPAFSRSMLAGYLDARVAAGQLAIEDTLLAASQFLEMSHGPLIKPCYFGVMVQPDDERVGIVISSALRVFMAAYRA